uniref:Exonuclease GOR n=1 Tax=Dermatophagoides pteronyssinus TaxID=6956 RepID=A0A6P6Y6M1_DERPT|nr:putative exonuclease GOR [Dermatophagoides pteronyssinus]
MFQTNAFFRYYQCPEKKLTKKCTRTFCQYNHGDNNNNNNNIGESIVVNYSQTNFGVDDFFTNLRPEDLEGYLPPATTTTTTSTTTTTLSTTTNSTNESIISPNSINFDEAGDDDNKIVNSKKSNIKCSTMKRTLSFEETSNSKHNSQLINSKNNNKTDDNRCSTVEKNQKLPEQVTNNLKKIRTLPVKKKHYREVMLERYAKIAALSKTDSNDSLKIDDTNTAAAANSNKSLIHKTNEYDNKKGQNSKITTNTNTNQKPEDIVKKFAINWMPIILPSVKIPFNIRVRNIRRIYQELYTNKSNNKNENDLCNEAKEIEKEICLRSKSWSSLYSSLLASKIRSIRNGDDNDKISDSKKPRIKIETSVVNNMSIVRKSKITYNDLNPVQLVKFLEQLILPENNQLEYGFPIMDNENNIALFSKNEWNNRKQFINTLINYNENIFINCDRCTKTYKNPQNPMESTCVFHPKHAYNIRTNGRIERFYVCCNNEAGSIGCQSMNVHITKGYQFIETRNGFCHTISRPTEIPKAYALDCEMCYTESACEICRITIINFNGEVIYDKLVKPKTKIIDYATKYSGINETDLLNVTNTLMDIQNDLKELISSETIIIGHGLDSDFRALKLIHKRIIDTTYLFPHKRGLPFKKSLKTLAVDHLNRIIQEDDLGHDSAEDAKAALDLVKIRLQDIINKHNV